MNSVTIFSACGLYRELYEPAPGLLLRAKPHIDKRNILDSNSIFWSEVLSKERINETVAFALERAKQPEYVPLYYKAISANPEAFSSRVISARTKIADHGISPKEFYSHVETLNIYCSLYAKTFSEDLAFTIQNGWSLSEESAQVIYESCLDETINPYLSFIKARIMPPLISAIPKLVFLSGRPGYFAFALARLLKQAIPSVLICITRHSSEYYSMNKIDFLLKRNLYLFRAFDVVLLEHFASAERELIDAVSQHRPIESIKNLLCKTATHEIQHTGYQTPVDIGVRCDIRRSPWYESEMLETPPHKIADVHLHPNAKCHWNKCAFCGINQKYHFENSSMTTDAFDCKADELTELMDQGVSHIWFIDEALSPNVLRKVAAFLIQSNRDIVWQARCRIEQELLEDGLPELLALSGLRELRLGLESGSYSVLNKMNKFDSSFSFSLVDELCCKYSDCGISLHFPMIIGFPGEMDADRNATYALLTKLTGKYPLVTFNINVFGLDISSRVFQKWADFGIQSISFPCDPAFFLGNMVQWQAYSIATNTLLREQSQIMRESLYPWMPSRSLTPPHIIYRLSETIRNTLFWKDIAAGTTEKNSTGNRANAKMQSGDITTFFDEEKKVYYIYSWKSHHYMLGGHFVANLLDLFRIPENPERALKIACEQSNVQYVEEEMKVLIERLLSYQYLTIIE